MRKLICSILLIVATLGVYAAVTRAALVWNDQATVAQADHLSWRPVPKQAFEPLAPTVWRGLERLSRGGSASPNWTRTLHDANLLLHVGSTLLVFLILTLLLQSEGAALLGAAFFALHPLQSESVAYVAAFKVVLGTFFALLALWQFLLYAKSLQHGLRRRQSRRSYYVATAAFVLAVLADAAMVVTPLIALILARLLPKQTSLYSAKVPIWRVGLWLLLGLPSAVWIIRSQETTVLSQMLPLWVKPLVAGDALSFYMAKTLVPLGIGPDYGRSPILLLGHWWGYVTWVIPALVLLIVSSSRSKMRDWHSAPLLVFFIALAPALGLIYFEAQTTSTVAGRYAYFAGLGPALIVGFIALKAKRVWVPLALAGAVAACGVLTFQDLKHWQSNEALWQHGLKVNPGSPIAHTKLGDDAMKRGDWQAARDDYMAVLAANAFSPTVYFNLGEIEREHGEAAKAISYYEHALQLQPSLAPAYERLGSIYLATGDQDAAMRNFTKAIDLEPEHAESLRQVGTILVRKGEYAEGIPYLMKAVRLGDAGAEDVQHRAVAHALLGLALNSTNQRGPAQEHLELALQLAPDSREANRTLADIYYKQGQYDRARGHYEKAVSEGTKDFEVFNALGIICSNHKEFSKALPYFNAALAIKPEAAATLQDIGIAYFHLRQQKDAAASFKKALAVNPDLAASHFYLGDLARWQGKEPEALHEYQAALKIDPNFAEAHYRLGNHYLKNDQLTLAIQQFKDGLRSAPDDPKLLYGLKRAEKARDTASSGTAAGTAEF